MFAGIDAMSGDRQVDDIETLAKEVEAIWRKLRPRLMQLYEASNQVGARTKEAARMWRFASKHLQHEGLPHDQADNLALHECVRLPDIDDGDEAEILKGLRGGHC